MAGKPFKAGRFAHTLRVRLMREHLGVDVDALVEEDLFMTGSSMAESHKEPWSPNADTAHGRESTVPSASGSSVGEGNLSNI
jgi:phospholipase D1/2